MKKVKKIFELVINPDDDLSGVDFNSFVEMPSSLLKMYEEIGKEKNLLTIGGKKNEC